MIDLEQRGNEYALISKLPDGTKKELLLSEDDILTLAQSALRLRDHIHAAQSRPGADLNALTVTPVVQVGLNTDALATEIHLTMTVQGGVEMTLSMPPNLAKTLVENLLGLISKIENQERKRTKQ